MTKLILTIATLAFLLVYINAESSSSSSSEEFVDCVDVVKRSVSLDDDGESNDKKSVYKRSTESIEDAASEIGGALLKKYLIETIGKRSAESGDDDKDDKSGKSVALANDNSDQDKRNLKKRSLASFEYDAEEKYGNNIFGA